MTSNRKKRHRGENWLEEDKIILTDLVKDRVREIENKHTDTTSNTLKVAAWNGLKERFNCLCKGTPRSVPQLKAQWGLLKLKAKKNIAEQRREILKSSGPSIKPISITEISSWLPNEFFDEFDSDKINEDKIDDSTCSKQLDVITINFEATSSPIPSGSQSMGPSPAPSPTPLSSSQVVSPKPTKIKRKVYKSKMSVISPAQKIAECELECRRELHAMQMKNEHLRAENLKLEAELLNHKIVYYKKRI